MCTHNVKKQIEFLKSFNLKTEEEKTLMAGIIHNLVDPWLSFCVGEAAYRLDEIAKECGGTEVSDEDITKLARKLYEDDRLIDCDLSDQVAREVYWNGMHVIGDTFPANRQHKCFKYSDDTSMIRVSETGWQCRCGLSETSEDAFDNLLDMDLDWSPLKIYFPCDDPTKILEENRWQAETILRRYSIADESLTADAAAIVLETSETSHLGAVIGELAKIFGFTEKEDK